MIQENRYYFNSSQELALALFSKRMELCQIVPKRKYPNYQGWQNTNTAELVKRWPSGYGIGIRTGHDGLIGIDLDIYDVSVVNKLLECFKSLDFLTRTGNPPKTLIPVICPEVSGKLLSDQWKDHDDVLNRIEILSYGQQFVAYGIHPDTNKPYQWSGNLLDHDLPRVPLTLIGILFKRFNELAGLLGWTNLTAKQKQVKKVVVRRSNNSISRPGDIYNRCCPITDVLLEYGWKHYRGPYWTRPGKKHGVSGSVFQGSNTFYCFSSSTCLIPDKLYDNFGLLTMYEYGGDFKAAAEAVRVIMKETK